MLDVVCVCVWRLHGFFPTQLGMLGRWPAHLLGFCWPVADRSYLQLCFSKAQHGLRNSLLVAPMPTASTAQILGNNESNPTRRTCTSAGFCPVNLCRPRWQNGGKPGETDDFNLNSVGHGLFCFFRFGWFFVDILKNFQHMVWQLVTRCFSAIVFVNVDILKKNVGCFVPQKKWRAHTDTFVARSSECFNMSWSCFHPMDSNTLKPNFTHSPFYLMNVFGR